MNPFELPSWLNDSPAAQDASPPEVVADPQILERNLAALSRRSPEVARAVRRARASREIEFVMGEDGAWSASLREPSSGQLRQLASKRRPLDEAARLAASVAIESAGGIVVLGFGLGHHVAALAARIGRSGIVLVLEPDLELLRAVLERIDLSNAFASCAIVVLTDPDDSSAISRAVQGAEGLLAMGVKFIEHPPSRARLAGSAEVFTSRFAEVMRALRTTVVTTLVQVNTTLRNTLMNVGRYASAPGIGDLAGVGAGRAAVVVSAGPSLHRNIDELCKPGVRDRVVIIAVQTVLKTLLSRGVVPHFVTALDYAELSARFYEGLTRRDVEGCTLVVQAMANPAIFRAFPGDVRCPRDEILDRVLGDAQPARFASSRGELRLGATVAHMAYYLARHLGCDPVILVGQDLGFTDGQYYAANAAIHRVWSGELNEFNTLEMLEWQRIVRSRSMLHRATDVLGRPVYTDEQMATYLAQFERDFAIDEGAGRTVIDATEGGVSKRHTRALSLASALSLHSHEGGVNFPAALACPDATSVVARVEGRLREVRREALRVASLSRSAGETLTRMSGAQSGAERNRLIERVYELRDRVERQATGYHLTQFLNQTGALNRAKADRGIELDRSLTPAERQAKQIERDTRNVTWLADAADEVGEMLSEVSKGMNSGQYRAGTQLQRAGALGSAEGVKPQMRKRVVAVVQVDFERGGLGTPRDLASVVAGGRNALALTVKRLAKCHGLDGIVLVSGDPARARALLGPLPPGCEVTTLSCDSELLRARTISVGTARVMAARSWRGGLGGLSVFDEACCPRITAAALAQVNADAALVIGADWALTDPVLNDAVIERYRENPELHGITFTQAAPGLVGCVVSHEVLNELGAKQDEIGPIASIGGMLGYIPVAPMGDPIAKPTCVTIAPSLRDAGGRYTVDTAARLGASRGLLERVAMDTEHVPAEEIVASPVGSHGAGLGAGAPEIVRVELTRTRPARGERDEWYRAASTPEAGDGAANTDMTVAQARDLLASLQSTAPRAVVSFEGRGDPMLHPQWEEIVADAMHRGFAAVHVRTDLSCGACEVERVLEILARGPGILSVDVLAASAATYAKLTGNDRYEIVIENVERALTLRTLTGGLPTPWIVPRIMRCDAVYSELERFYDSSLMRAGAAVIDPLPVAAKGDRIAPLPVGEHVKLRVRLTTMVVRSDGSVASDPCVPWGAARGSIFQQSPTELWAAQQEGVEKRKSFDGPDEASVGGREVA